MIPKNINKEHLEKAIKEIDKDGVRKGRHSSTYDLIHNGKTYPPKLVLSIANRYANGTELDSNDFGGGKDTPAFELMKAEGFEIIPKNDPIKSLIENYKKRITETELKDEIYKWELVNEYRGRPNPETPDFYKEIKDVKFKNLIYAMGMAVINHLAKDKPEELRQLFINLFDETKDLTERVKSFNKDTLKIYRELGETLQHHQDERSIATYLTFHNSDKYTFYKSSFYKKYCKLIGVKPAKKNEKYTHYLSLVDELIEKYGADTLRLYEMFLGPLEQDKPWDTNGIEGVFRFLRKLWRLYFDENDTIIVTSEKANDNELKSLHKAIKKVTSDIERFSFNTGVSAFMICVNELNDLNCHKKEILEPLAILISPYAPHIAEEIWQSLGNNESISEEHYPIHDDKLLVENNFEYPVSFNGKLRFKLALPINMPKDEVEKAAINAEEAKKWLDGKTIKKIIQFVISMKKEILNI